MMTFLFTMQISELLTEAVLAYFVWKNRFQIVAAIRRYLDTPTTLSRIENLTTEAITTARDSRRLAGKAFRVSNRIRRTQKTGRGEAA
jgi:hypothetical protein